MMGFLGRARARDFLLGVWIGTTWAPAAALADDILVGAPSFEITDPSRVAAVVSERMLKESQPLTVADALRAVPGVEVVRQGPVGQTTSIFLRGARSESTLVLVDGAELNDVISPGAGYDFSYLTANNIARIEVYRGPQTVRFGLGALGGVINIITKDGSGPAGLSYLAEAGSYRTDRQSLRGQRGTGAIGWSLGIDRFSSGGFSAAAPGAEADGAKLYSGSAKLSWRASPTAQVTGILRFNRGKVDTDRNGGPGGDDPNSESRAQQLTAGLSGHDWFFNQAVRVQTGVYYGKLNREDENRPDVSDTASSYARFRSRTLRAQSEAEWFLREGHSLRLNLQARWERGAARTDYQGLASEFSERKQSTFGQALTYLYENRRWFADFGLRRDGGSAIGSRASSRISWGRFLGDQQNKAFLTFGTGLKPASLYQRYSIFGRESLRPESARSIEANLELALSQASSLRLSAYHTDFFAMIDYDPARNLYFNLNRARSRGADVSFGWRLGGGWEIDGTYAFLRAFDRDTRAALLRRPRHGAGATLRYREGKWEASSAVRFRSSRMDIDPVTFSRISLGGYGLWELNGSYQFARWLRAGLKIENILNRKYEEVAGYGTPGRNFLVRLEGDL